MLSGRARSKGKPMIFKRFAWLSLACWLPLAAGAEPADYADLDTVVVVTQDEDGDARETTIWITVVDDTAYIRTGGSTWGDNVVRDPSLTLRTESGEQAYTAEFVEDDPLRERITASFREKYGFSDSMISWIRGSRPKIMRLVAP